MLLSFAKKSREESDLFWVPENQSLLSFSSKQSLRFVFGFMKGGYLNFWIKQGLCMAMYKEERRKWTKTQTNSRLNGEKPIPYMFTLKVSAALQHFVFLALYCLTISSWQMRIHKINIIHFVAVACHLSLHLGLPTNNTHCQKAQQKRFPWGSGWPLTAFCPLNGLL